jgi:hypothetical protein
MSKPSYLMDKQLDKIFETIISCKTIEQLDTTKQWVDRLGTRSSVKHLVNCEKFRANFIATLKRKNDLFSKYGGNYASELQTQDPVQ